MNKLARESRPGQMDHNTMALTRMVRRMVKVSTCGPMVPRTTESGTTIASAGEALTSGMTADNSLASGKTIAWTAKDSTPGLTVDATKGSMCKTRSTEEVSTLGPMEDLTMVNGKMVSNTERAPITIQMLT